MDLALGRLSLGECERTLSGADNFVLQQSGAPTLSVDNGRFRRLMSQWGAVVLPGVLAPVTTGGPRGFDVTLDAHATGISESADYWERGTRGSGRAASTTCNGRNEAVRSSLGGGQLRIAKGLPLGITIAANFGKLFRTELWTAGGELRLALVEGMRSPLVPDVAVRFAANGLVGEPVLSLTTLGADLLVSKGFASPVGLRVSPYLGLGVHWIVVRTGVVDLTPNIDSTLCAAGVDPVCNAQGLGASADDTGHDRSFADVALHRYRASLGLWAHYGLVALAAELGFDVVPPGTADSKAGDSLPRQWSAHVAPSLSF